MAADDESDPAWFFRRTSSAPEQDGRVRAGANLSKRAWRPAAQRDLLAKHSYDSNFKWDLASKSEVVASCASLLSMRGGAQRHETARSSSISLPPSPLLPPGRAALSHCGSSAAPSYASSTTSCFPSPACDFAVYEGSHWMRDGALTPMSDISDMEDDGDNSLQRTGSGEGPHRCCQRARANTQILTSVLHFIPQPLTSYHKGAKLAMGATSQVIVRASGFNLTAKY